MRLLVRRFSYFILLLALAFSASAQHKFSLREAIDYAIANNENIKNAQVATRDADAQIYETRADGLPQVNASLSYNNNLKIQRIFLPGAFDGSGQTPPDETFAAQFGVQHQGTFGVTATQMLWDGSFFIGLKAAKVLKEKVIVDEKKATADVVEQVTKSYYLVLVNQVRTELILANISTLESTLNETKTLYENGFAEKIDVTRLQVQLNNLKAEQQAVKQAISSSNDILKLSMGMPVTDALELSDALEDFNFDYNASEINDFQVQSRIEVKQLDYLKNLAELDIKNVTSQYIPKVSLSYGWGRNAGDDSFANLWNGNRQWFTNSNLGININIPVFDGLRKKYSIARKKYQLETLDNQYGQLLNSLKQQLVSAEEALAVNLLQLKVQEENMDLAKEVSDITREKFTEGVGSNLELINAEKDYKEAEINYLSALYNAIVAKIDLDKALGKLQN